MLFSDIEGSTALLQRLGTDRYGEALDLHRTLLREAFERHGGYEVDYEGDAFFVAFQSAGRAVVAATEGQRALAVAEWPEDGEIRVRMGIHTGEPLAAPPKYVGLDVHKAARIMAAGHGGQVLLSAATQRLVAAQVELRPLGEHRLKDLLQPEPLFQLVIEGLPSDFPALKTLENRPTNLPVQPDAMIGRQREISEVAALLRESALRLVTLTGPGGTGKTRLALQAAAELIDEFPDGVFFVALAPLSDPGLVVSAIGQALALRELAGEELADTVAAYLEQRQLLLLLDNFEQVVGAASAVAGLLERCRKVKVMVTSRERLRLRGERAYPVEPLPLVDPEADLDALVRNDAVALFAARAEAASGSFVLEASNASVVARICARLDGLPLAIELAAARVAALPPQALLARLEQRLSLLTRGARDADERQQTLRATIDWSYRLLSEAERGLFERMSVFVDGCRLEAAEAVCEDFGDAQLLDLVSALIEKSLVRQGLDPDGRPRYWILETIREYAFACLVDRGQGDSTADRHCAHFLAVAEQTALLSRTADQGALFAGLDSDEANLRAAFEHATTEERLRFATSLWGYWAARGRISDWLPRMEEAVAATAQPPAAALVGLATLRHLAGFDSNRLLPDVERAAEIAEQTGDDFTAAQALALTGRMLASGLGRQAAGEQAWQRALGYVERGGYRTLRAEIIGWLMVMSIFGPLPTSQGIARCTGFLESSEGDESIEAFAQVELSVLRAMRGDFDAARELLATGHAIFRRLGLNVWAANNGQEGFYVEMLAGEPAAAVSLLSASYRELDQMGERGFLSTIAGMLAHALHATGDDEQAERFSVSSEQAAASDDVFSQVLWRTARAKICARNGDVETAQRLACEAITLSPAAEMPNLTADAYTDLAVVLEAMAMDEKADAALREAERLYEQKENLVSLARTKQRLQRSSRPAV